MARYRISASITVSLRTYVEANSPEEAVANCEAELPGLCHRCASSDGEGEWSLSGELDGEPFDLTAELDE